MDESTTHSTGSKVSFEKMMHSFAVIVMQNSIIIKHIFHSVNKTFIDIENVYKLTENIYCFHFQTEIQYLLHILYYCIASASVPLTLY